MCVCVCLCVFLKCVNSERSKYFSIHCYLSSQFQETLHSVVARVCGSQTDPSDADLFCSQIFITPSSIFSSPPSSYHRLWQPQPRQLLSREKTQEATCLIMQEKSSCGSKLCNLKSSQVGNIKCEVITAVSFCCSAAPRRRKNNLPAMWIMLLTVMRSGLKKLINTRKVFFSQKMKGNEIEILRNVINVTEMLEKRMKYQLARSCRCKLTCSQFDPGLSLGSRAMILHNH